MTRKGFTLLELLMVVVVFLILLGITFGLLSAVDSAKRRLTESRVHALGVQAASLVGLKGAPPERLEDLLPAMGHPDWTKNGIFVDAWDHPFEYRVDGKRFDVWSWGPDGISGTSDDIHFRRN